MTDIVKQLRKHSDGELVEGFDRTEWAEEAANEIERLRGVNNVLANEVDEYVKEIVRLRAQGPRQIDYIIDGHGIVHRSFTIIFKSEGEQ